MSTKKMTVAECLNEYKETTDQIRLLERKKHEMHDKLISYLIEKKLEHITSDKYSIKISEQNREIISKKDVPVEIWNQYKRQVTFPVLTVSSINKPKNRSK